MFTPQQIYYQLIPTKPQVALVVPVVPLPLTNLENEITNVELVLEVSHEKPGRVARRLFHVVQDICSHILFMFVSPTRRHLESIVKESVCR